MNTTIKSDNAEPSKALITTKHLLTTNHLFVTNRLAVRLLNESDLAVFTDYRADKSVEKYQSWQNFIYQDAVSLLKTVNQIPFGQKGSRYQLAITAKNNHKLLGDLAVHFVDDEKAEIGFTVAPEYQRQGIAYESLVALEKQLFTQQKIKQIVTFVDVKNKASIHLLEKLGFKRIRHLTAQNSQYAQWGEEYFYLKNDPNTKKF